MAETVFWPIYQEDFSHIDLCGKTANNINFHYRTVSRKINDHSFLYIKTPLFLDYFWVISPFLGGRGGGGGKKSLPRKFSCHTQPDKGFQYQAKIQRILIIQFKFKKHANRQQSYLIGHFQPLPGVQQVQLQQTGI